MKLTIDTLIINSYGLTISIKTIPVLLKIKELMAALFTILVKGARKCQKPLTVFKALCHGASCMQANGAEGRKNDRLRKEKKRKESN